MHILYKYVLFLVAADPGKCQHVSVPLPLDDLGRAAGTGGGDQGRDPCAGSSPRPPGQRQPRPCDTAQPGPARHHHQPPHLEHGHRGLRHESILSLDVHLRRRLSELRARLARLPVRWVPAPGDDARRGVQSERRELRQGVRDRAGLFRKAVDEVSCAPVEVNSVPKSANIVPKLCQNCAPKLG